MEFCVQCQKTVPTFIQTCKTFPQDPSNKIRVYKDTLCTVCGNAIRASYEDIVPKGTDK